MAVPVSQMWTVASYMIGQRLRGRSKFPLVLMLEPLFRCNLACAGCGKIQYPGHILKKEMSVEDALRAVDECGAPMVSIPGGEPLMHTGIHEIVAGLIARRKYIYLCTNAILMKEKLEQGRFAPSKYLTFSVHMDGDMEAHDYAVCREGIYTKAEEAIRLAVKMGFRVTTNTTLFQHADVARTRQFLDRMMEIGVEGMMVSPGYGYQKAPDQENFLSRQRTFDLFRSILKDASKMGWRWNQSPLFMEFLMGKRHMECTPWGMPSYSIFGWQRPCYLLGEGYAKTYDDLVATTNWDDYGRASGNQKCQQCMVHSGYEATAVWLTFNTLEGFVATVRNTLFGVESRRGKNIRPPAVTRRAVTGAEAAEAGLEKALHDAVDFRGDVVIATRDGKRHAGYLFSIDPHTVDLFPSSGAGAIAIPRAEIVAVEKTGRDAADGKTWEAWHRKYMENKAREARGERKLNIDLHAEALS